MITFLLGWVPICTFFMILTTMFLVDFGSPVDEYFVRVVLRSVLILIAATCLAQVFCIVLVTCFHQCTGVPVVNQTLERFRYVSTFPVVTLGVFSAALFFRSLAFDEWVYFLSLLLLVPTTYYWLKHFSGALKQLGDFAYYHKVPRSRRLTVLFPFFLTYFVDYFFLSLKRALLPMVFILVVSDYKIILPRLVDAGMTYKAFILFISLFISLHILSYKEDLR